MQAQMIVHRDRKVTLIGAVAFIFFGVLLLFLMIAKPAFAAPTFAAQTPANGATLSAAPTSVSVAVADTAANLPAVGSMTLKIDGVAVSAKTLTLSDAKNGVLAGVPAGVLLPGLHTVSVSVTSALKAYTSTWSFTIDEQVPVSIWPVAPADASTINLVHPKVSITAPANAAALVTDVTFSVDGGAPMPAVYNASTGVATLDPSVLRFADGGTHTITATVSGTVSGTKTWSFTVERYQPSTPIANLECAQCHGSAAVTAAHDMTNCAACHGPSAPLGGTAYTTADQSPHTAANKDCAVCHGVAAVSCATCHNTSATGAATHDLAALPAAHTTSATTCSGTNCHSNSLFTEHAANAAGCGLCHASDARAEAAAAVAAGDTSCSACHGTGPHADLSSNTATCQDCHSKGATNPKAAPASAQVDFSWWAGSSHDLSGIGDTSASANDASCVLCHDPHVKGDSGMGALSYNQTAPAANAQALCLTCHTANKPAELAGKTVADLSVYTTSGHNKSVKCSNCHAVHGSANASLQSYTSVDGTILDPAASGNTLCFKCHGTGATTVNGVNMDVATAMTGTNIQPHGNGTLNCSDCHNQHAAQAGLSPDRANINTTYNSWASTYVNSSVGGKVLIGAAGVNPQWSTTPYTPNVSAQTALYYSWYENGDWNVPALNPTTLTATSNESTLCFKCHSTAGGTVTVPAKGTALAYTYTRTNQAQEFNPNNASFHNVAGVATTPASKTSLTVWTGTPGTPTVATQTTLTWGFPTTGTLKSPWTANSTMTCTDCHTGASVAGAKGPHGSSAKFMIDPAYPVDFQSTAAYLGSSGTFPAGLICSKCHNGGANKVHTTSNHDSTSNGVCVICHVAVPHGWIRPRLLAYSTDPAPYNGSTLGLTGVTTTKMNQGFKAVSTHTVSGTGTAQTVAWSAGDCASSCSSSNHPAIASGTNYLR